MLDQGVKNTPDPGLPVGAAGFTGAVHVGREGAVFGIGRG